MWRFKRLSIPFSRGLFMSTDATQCGPMERSMRAKLMAELQPTELEIRNDSWKHRNHPAMIAEGASSPETHFFVQVVSELFKGKTTMQRHRMIYATLAEELAQGLHALSLMTKTPEEIQKVETK